MRFEGNRTLKESIPHYFPTLNNSYIIFEIKSIRYYCILVKRTEDNHITYYLLEHAYQEDFFFTKKEEGKQVIPFDKLKVQLAEKNILLKELNRDELYRQVYSTERADKPVLLLSKEKQTKVKSRLYKVFTQIYRHLISAVRPSDEDLTDMVIAASHTDTRDLTVLAESSSTNLDKMERLREEARKLKQIKPDFETLKKEYASLTQRTQHLGKAYYTFSERYPEEVEKLNNALETKQKKITDLKKRLAELQQQKETLLQEKGRCQSTIEQQKDTLVQISEKLKAIAPYESKLAFSALETEAEKFEAQKQYLKKALYGSGSKPKDTKTLTADLTQLKHTCAQLEDSIKNFSNTLIQHISRNPKIRKRLNTLLSNELLYLPKTAIKKQVSQVSGEFTLFDGKIDTSSITSEKPFATLEELREQLNEKSAAQKATQQLLDNQEALAHTEAQWLKRLDLLRQVREKPTLLAQETAAKKELQKMQEQEKEYIQQLQTHEKTKENTIQTLNRQKEEYQRDNTFKKDYTLWRKEFATYSLPITKQLLPEKNLRKLKEQVEEEYRQANDQKYKATKMMGKISSHLGEYPTDDLEHFIKNLQDRFDSSHEHQDTLLEGVINSFVTPIQHFLNRYRELKDHIKDFSKKLASYHISGIKKIELHVQEAQSLLKDLTKMSHLKQNIPPLFEGSQHNEHLQLLRTYIDRRETFKLKRLFKLQLKKLTKEGDRPKMLDFSKQMESYGTDKVLRIFIYLMLLKQFFVLEPGNRVAIYIDEVSAIDPLNIQRILDLCEKYHILPIFASVEVKPELNNYYLLLRSDKNNRKVYVGEPRIVKKQPKSLAHAE